MMSIRFLSLLCGLPFVLSAPTDSVDFETLVQHEQRSAVPKGYAASGAAPPDDLLTLRFALVQGNMSGLEKRFYAVSTPGNEEYGKHLSKEEVETYVKPSDTTASLAAEWFASNGLAILSTSDAGDVISVSLSVAEANALLATNFTIFTHEQTNTTHVRAMEYSIPQALLGHIDHVHPTISFDAHFPTTDWVLTEKPWNTMTARADERINTRDGIVAVCDKNMITPACLQALYGIPTTPAKRGLNILGVAGYLDQFANKFDLEKFLTTYRPDVQNMTTFNVVDFDGGSNSQVLRKAGIEANLDIQYTVGLATGVPVTFFSEGLDGHDGTGIGWIDMVDHLLERDILPSVFTNSYGVNEDLISPLLARHACDAYMQLGVRGTSVIFASGDGGVSGGHVHDQCDTSVFVPTFPASCPYITAVGATQGFAPESAWGNSSGGFSNYFAQPAYQSSAVAGYLAANGNATDPKMFNASGRAFPDVSAQGVHLGFVLEQQLLPVSGTSASAPIFASILALLNDELMVAGKSRLGFLNPFLYTKAADAFNSITSGGNMICSAEPAFPALKGWSPVTGLGTPIYEMLRSAAGLANN